MCPRYASVGRKLVPPAGAPCAMGRGPVLHFGAASNVTGTLPRLPHAPNTTSEKDLSALGRGPPYGYYTSPSHPMLPQHGVQVRPFTQVQDSGKRAAVDLEDVKQAHDVGVPQALHRQSGKVCRSVGRPHGARTLHTIHTCAHTHLKDLYSIITCFRKFCRLLHTSPHMRPHFAHTHLVDLVLPDRMLHVALLLGLTPVWVQLVDLACRVLELVQVISLQAQRSISKST